MSEATTSISWSNVTEDPGGGGVGGDDGYLFGNKDEMMLVLLYSASCLGIPGNLLAILVLSSARHLSRKPINRFIIHQACIDAFSCVLKILEEIFNEKNVVEPVVCHMFLTKMASGMTFYASTYNMVFLTIERYLAITNPLKYDPDKVRRRLPFVFLVTWVLCILALIMVPAATVIRGGVCLVGWKVHGTFWLDYYYTPHCFVISFGIPISIMVFCYVRMFLALRTSMKSTLIPSTAAQTTSTTAQTTSTTAQTSTKPAHNIRKTDTNTEQQATAVHKRRLAQMNIFQTCLTLAVLTTACWLTNIAGLLMYIVGYYTDLSNDHSNYGQWLLICNALLNPYVYVLRYKEFQTQMKVLFCKSTRAAK